MGLLLILMIFVSIVTLGIIERRISRRRFEVSRQRLQQLQKDSADDVEEPIQLSRNSSWVSLEVTWVPAEQPCVVFFAELVLLDDWFVSTRQLLLSGVINYVDQHIDLTPVAPTQASPTRSFAPVRCIPSYAQRLLEILPAAYYLIILLKFCDLLPITNLCYLWVLVAISCIWGSMKTPKRYLLPTQRLYIRRKCRHRLTPMEVAVRKGL